MLSIAQIKTLKRLSGWKVGDFPYKRTDFISSTIDALHRRGLVYAERGISTDFSSDAGPMHRSMGLASYYITELGRTTLARIEAALKEEGNG